MKKLAVAALLATFTFGLQACVLVPEDDGDLLITDDPCVAACDDHSECYPGGVDCEALCDDQADRGCDEEYTDLVECLNEQDDICSDDGACNPERDAFEACLEPTLSG
jgi:hypothetical protein